MSALKWAVILGGAAYLFRDQLETALGMATANTSAPSSPAPAPPIVGNDAGTPERMLQLALSQGNITSPTDRLNGWQWAWLYQHVRGIAPPTIAAAGPELLSINEWWAQAKAADPTLSGIPRRTRAAQAWSY